MYPAVMGRSHLLTNVSCEIMRHVSLYICLILLSAVSSRFVHWVALCGLCGERLFDREHTCKNMWSFSWNSLCGQSSATIREHSGLQTTPQRAIGITLSLMAQICLNRPSPAWIQAWLPFPPAWLITNQSHDSSLINHKRMLLSAKKKKKCVCYKGQDILEKRSQLKTNKIPCSISQLGGGGLRDSPWSWLGLSNGLH